MKNKYFRPQLFGTLMIFMLVFTVLGIGQNQVVSVSAQGPGGVNVVRDYKHDVSPPVRNIQPLPLPQIPEHEENAPIKIGRHQDQPDSVVQNYLATPAMPGTNLNFDGIPFPGVDCNCAPPDTNGEVGLTQYVQIVNEGFQVFNKIDGTSAFGPVGISTLWSGFGGVCQTNGVGDPVVLYDQIADRWVISQFAGKHVPTDECIAVSTTSDATGSYYRYGFHLGTSFFDYPKLGVWPDAYYMSMNVFNTGGTAFYGPQPFAFDRAAMLDGNSATYITPGITGGSSEETYLPSDLDGSTPPPAGAPNTFVEWPNGGVYKVFHFHVDFATPANSSFTLFATPPAAGFTALCLSTRACVPEPNGSALDALADRFMFRLAYRNFGDHESVVTNYTVSSGGVAGIRWIELRDVTNGPVTVHQESTYQPDNTWRWLGSAAMDGNGNLAIGFSVSSSAVVPGIRYAGRLAGDTLNTLGQGESVLFAGLGSQTGTSNRWGDYSDLTVDPVDDCTFWYTNEYYPGGSSQFNWRTRIGSFKFETCSGSGSPTVPGAPTLAASGGDAVVHLAWSAPSDGGSSITNYNVYRATSSGAEVLLTTLGKITSFDDTSVTNGTTYYYEVSALNSVGEGAQSNEASATPQGNATAPDAPTLSGSAGDAIVHLTWTTPSNGGSPISNYKVYRGSSSGGESLLTTLGSVTSYDDTTVTNSNTYYYKVSAVNGVGEGTQSNEVSATPQGGGGATVPSAPQNLTAEQAKGKGVQLNWSPPSSDGGSQITGYNIYRGDISGNETFLTSVGNLTSYKDTSTSRGQTYYYFVVAVNTVGESPASKEASAVAK